METDTTREFDLDKRKKECQLTTDKIKIKKEALIDDIAFEFTMVEPELDAEVTCRAGNVVSLEVTEIAQRCGIGQILMQLCFNEERIHNVVNMQNAAVEKIKYSKLPKAEQMGEWVKSKCKKIVSLTMNTKKAAAAHVYFNSALDSGFTEMFIALKDEFYPKDGPGSVRLLKERYTDDGYMKDNEGNEKNKVKVHGGEWFFCKENRKRKVE